MPNHITGRVRITVDGNLLTSKEGATIDIGGVSREARASDIGVAGYSESTAVPSVECSIEHYGSTSLQDFADITDSTLLFETDTGKVYTLSHAWVASPPKMTKGEVSLVFNAKTCVES